MSVDLSIWEAEELEASLGDIRPWPLMTLNRKAMRELSMN